AGKRIASFESDSANPQEIFSTILQGTHWRAVSIPSRYLGMYRSYEASKSNALEIISDMKEIYDFVVIWDTANRSFSLVDPNEYGNYRGMQVDYGNLLESVNVTRESENLVTRLYIEGNEGLG